MSAKFIKICGERYSYIINTERIFTIKRECNSKMIEITYLDGNFERIVLPNVENAEDTFDIIFATLDD
jgi:hypothetical protein